MKIFLILCLLHFGSNVIAQKQNILDSTISMLVYNIYTDKSIQESGNLLSYPNEVTKNTNGKPTKIHFLFVNRINQDAIERISFNFKSKVKFIDTVHPLFIFQNPIIDSSSKIFANKEVYVLGTLIVVGIYIPTKSHLSTTNEIYFDIIKIGREFKKSQLNQVIKLIKRNKTWVIDTSIVLSRS